MGYIQALDPEIWEELARARAEAAAAIEARIAIEEHDRIVIDLLDCYIENRIDRYAMKRAFKDPVYAAQLRQELLGGQAPEQTTGLS